MRELAALLVAVVVGVVSTDETDLGYWRRWVPARARVCLRSLMVGVPAAAAVAMEVAEPLRRVAAPAALAHGALVGLVVAVAMQTDLARPVRRGRGRAASVPAEARRALTWLHHRLAERLDGAASTAISAEFDLARTEFDGGSTRRLVRHAEAMWAHWTHLATTHAGEAAGVEALEQARLVASHLDVVRAPAGGADDKDRALAADGLAMLLPEQFREVRWSRNLRPAP